MKAAMTMGNSSYIHSCGIADQLTKIVSLAKRIGPPEVRNGHGQRKNKKGAYKPIHFRNV